LTANLSAMSDQEVLAWLEKLKITFKLEKRKAVGPIVTEIENLRIRADRFNKRLHKKIFNKLPDNLLGNFIKKSYNFFYYLMQIYFDKIRLYLLGVKKY